MIIKFTPKNILIYLFLSIYSLEVKAQESPEIAFVEEVIAWITEQKSNINKSVKYATIEDFRKLMIELNSRPSYQTEDIKTSLHLANALLQYKIIEYIEMEGLKRDENECEKCRKLWTKVINTIDNIEERKVDKDMLNKFKEKLGYKRVTSNDLKTWCEKQLNKSSEKCENLPPCNSLDIEKLYQKHSNLLKKVIKSYKDFEDKPIEQITNRDKKQIKKIEKTVEELQNRGTRVIGECNDQFLFYLIKGMLYEMLLKFENKEDNCSKAHQNWYYAAYPHWDTESRHERQVNKYSRRIYNIIIDREWVLERYNRTKSCANFVRTCCEDTLTSMDTLAIRRYTEKPTIKLDKIRDEFLKMHGEESCCAKLTELDPLLPETNPVPVKCTCLDPAFEKYYDSTGTHHDYNLCFDTIPNGSILVTTRNANTINQQFSQQLQGTPLENLTKGKLVFKDGDKGSLIVEYQADLETAKVVSREAGLPIGVYQYGAIENVFYEIFRFLENQLNETNVGKKMKDFKILGFIQGEADGMKIRKSGIKYENDYYINHFDDIQNQSYKVLGKLYPKPISLSNGERFYTNRELAFLRAFRIKRYIGKFTENSLEEVEIRIKENQEIGEAYRNISMQLEIIGYRLDPDFMKQKSEQELTVAKRESQIKAGNDEKLKELLTKRKCPK
ncbi:MAG: hypothetical protein SFU99_23440 [Saprospiraceae bacterium]|nr:hypothetical protein [Saprospiraceae bacterium]